MSTPTVGTYKGNPVLTLNPESKFPFTFGLKKAEMILENLEAIEKFVRASKEVPAPVEAPPAVADAA
jgi:hypothetical protein